MFLRAQSLLDRISGLGLSSLFAGHNGPNPVATTAPVPQNHDRPLTALEFQCTQTHIGKVIATMTSDDKENWTKLKMLLKHASHRCEEQGLTLLMHAGDSLKARGDDFYEQRIDVLMDVTRIAANTNVPAAQAQTAFDYIVSQAPSRDHNINSMIDFVQADWALRAMNARTAAAAPAPAAG